MTDLLDAATDALAVYRATRLVTQDRITEPLREAVWRHRPADKGIGYLITCPWCSSMWLAAGAAAARRVAPRVWRPVARVLALSGAAGWLTSRT